MSTAVLHPGQLEAAAGAFPTLRLPGPGLFAARARRLRALAPGRALEPFLLFAARLTECQDRLLDGLVPAPQPPADLLARCRAAATPPLAAPGWWPDGGWHSLARRLAGGVKSQAPDPAALERVARASGDWLEAQARALLAADIEGLELGSVPPIGAALQVCWSAAAARLDPGAIAPPGLGQGRPGRCPVCGSPPVAGVLRTGGPEDGLRYLHCGLCGTEWHAVRAKCSLCDNTRGIAYLSLAERTPDPNADPAREPQPAVQAETCPACRGYLKLCRLERDPGADPWADDLATLALDLLVDREGFERAGLNFLLLQSAR